MTDRVTVNCGDQLNDDCEGEKRMTNQLEIQELLKKAEETKQLIQDARDLLDAALEDLEEAYAEECEDMLQNVSDEDFAQ